MIYTYQWHSYAWIEPSTWHKAGLSARSLPSPIGHKCQICWWMQLELSMQCEEDSSTNTRSRVVHPQHVTRHLYKCCSGLYRTRKISQSMQTENNCKQLIYIMHVCIRQNFRGGQQWVHVQPVHMVQCCSQMCWCLENGLDSIMCIQYLLDCNC